MFSIFEMAQCELLRIEIISYELMCIAIKLK